MADNFSSGDKTTVPFFRIPQKDRDELVDKLIEFTDGDVNKVDARMIKTAVKSMVDKPDCVIVDKPMVVPEKYGDTLHIPIKNSPLPAIVSVKFMQDLVARKL